MNFIIHSGPGLGDIIQFLSMARSIKERYPESRVDLLIRGSKEIYNLNMQIIECQDYVDNLYWYAGKEIKHNISLLFELKKNKYDVGFVRIGVVTGKLSLWIYHIMRMVGCKKIIGSGTDKVDIRVSIPDRTHYLDRNAMLLQAIDIPARKDAISINIEKVDFEWMSELPLQEDGKNITLSVGTNSMIWKNNGEYIVYDVKSWSYDKWIKLASELVKLNYSVILMGGKKERKEILDLGLNIPNTNRIIDMIGKTTINQSFSLLKRSCLVVGSEGGMMHCASALGTKTLTVFGGSDYKMWNPGGKNSSIINLDLECAPCFCTSRGANCKNHKCLEQISVQTVLDRINELI